MRGGDDWRMGGRGGVMECDRDYGVGIEEGFEGLRVGGWVGGYEYDGGSGEGGVGDMCVRSGCGGWVRMCVV